MAVNQLLRAGLSYPGARLQYHRVFPHIMSGCCTPNDSTYMSSFWASQGGFLLSLLFICNILFQLVHWLCMLAVSALEPRGRFCSYAAVDSVWFARALAERDIFYTQSLCCTVSLGNIVLCCVYITIALS